MRDPEVVVKKRCKHGDLHPHTGYADDSGRRYYCTEGDMKTLLGPELQARLFSMLAGTHPRIEIDVASQKASQIVEELFGLLREGTVEWQ